MNKTASTPAIAVLQVSAEYYPLLKTGGLADVTGALPWALRAHGCDVRPLLPGFPALLDGLTGAREVATLQTPWGQSMRLLGGQVGGATAVNAYVLEAPGLLDRPGNPYEDSQRQPYADNHRRFAALAWAGAHLAGGADPTWRPAVVHGHDWHAGLVSAYLAQQVASPRVPSVFTVHNLAYQGLFDAAVFPELGLPPHCQQTEGMEFWGQISFLKAGLQYADRITTVSPTYAREIQTSEHGCGLDGLLRRRQGDLSGILNGVDDTVWNSATDPLLPHAFHVDDLSGKARCKAALQAEAGLRVFADTPVFTVVSRLTEQKGLPLVLGAVDDLVAQGAQLLVLGNGDAHLEAAFTAKAQQHTGSVAVRVGFDEAYSHRVFAGSDVALVPSRFEPCGLTQMYALRYGSVPLVRRVGGLADSVVDTDLITLSNQSATGVVFDRMEHGDFLYAVQRALALYRRPQDWLQLQRTGMQQPFSWDTAAAQYAQLYRSLLPLSTT